MLYEYKGHGVNGVRQECAEILSSPKITGIKIISSSIADPDLMVRGGQLPLRAPGSGIMKLVMETTDQN